MNEAQSEYMHFMMGKLTAFGFILLVGLAISLVLKGKRDDNKFVWWPTVVALVLISMSFIGGFLPSTESMPHEKMLVNVLDQGPRSEPVEIYDQQKLALIEKRQTQSVTEQLKTDGLTVSIQNSLTENGNTLRTDLRLNGVLKSTEVSGVANGRIMSVGCEMQVGPLVYENSDCSRKVESVFGKPKPSKSGSD